MPSYRASLPKRTASGKHHKSDITRSISDGNDDNGHPLPHDRDEVDTVREEEDDNDATSVRSCPDAKRGGRCKKSPNMLSRRIRSISDCNVDNGHPLPHDRDEVDTVREEEDDNDATSVRSCPDAKRGGRCKKSPHMLSRRIQSDSRASPFLYDIAEDQEEEVIDTSSLLRQIENIHHQDDEEFDCDNVGVEILHSSSESSSCMQLDEIIDNTMSVDSCSNDMYSLSDAAMAIRLSPTELSMLSAMSAATEKAGNVTSRINTSTSMTPAEELRTTLAKTMKELEKVDITLKAAEARKRAGLRVFYDPKAAQYPDTNAALMMAESSDSYDLHKAFNVLTGFVTNFNFNFRGKDGGSSSHKKAADKRLENMVFM